MNTTVLDVGAEVVRAHAVSTPVIAVSCPCPFTTQDKVVRKLLEFRAGLPAKSGVSADTPIAVWDSLRGVTAFVSAEPDLAKHNGAWSQAVKKIFPDPVQFVNPVSALFGALKLPKRGVLFMLNMHRQLGVEQPNAANDTVQALQLISSQLKAQGCSVVLLSPVFPAFPPEVNEISVIDEPLPGPEEIKGIIQDRFNDLQYGLKKAGKPAAPELTDDQMWHAVNACRALPGKIIDQVVAMALTPTGIEIGRLWVRKIQWIKEAAGIEVYRDGKELISDLGGITQLIAEFDSLGKSKRRVGYIAQFPEIDKQMMGAGGGDNTGITDHIIADLLELMENKKVRGYRLQGPPGTGKTHIIRALGNKLGVLFLVVRVGGMMNRFVGVSEERSAMVMKILAAIGDDPVFIGDSNREANIPAEMDRRFSSEGKYYVDLPSAEEKAVIWQKQMQAHGLAPQPLPEDTRWSGADIRNCCRKAQDRGLTLVDAAAMGMVPTGISRMMEIDAMRAAAKGCWCSASYPGLYQGPQDGATSYEQVGRLMDLGGGGGVAEA